MNQHAPSPTMPLRHFQRNSALTVADPGPWDAKALRLDEEILTVDDVAALLKMSKQQIYEQTRMRARVRQAIPLPFLRINGNL